MNGPKFATRDSSQAEFWTERYANEFMPWDQQGVPPELTRAVGEAHGTGELPTPPARVLIPGCGSGYELQCLAQAGYDAIAIDISPAAVGRARCQVDATYAHRIRLADCFAIDTDPAHAAQYAWVYERAFLCALPPRLWSRWAQAMARLVAPHGVLAGFFHFDPPQCAVPIGARRGPPFPMLTTELARLLEADFVCVADRPVSAATSVPVFRDKERWMVWRRRGE